MTALEPVLRRFAGMVLIAAVLWLLMRLAYAVLADLPAAAVLRPSAINLAVVLMVCLVAALFGKTR
jgi:hypothetical protein